MDNSDKRLLVVMAKAPVVGKVKTRLIPELGEYGAVEVYQQLLEETLKRAAERDSYVREISCSPDIHHPEFKRLSEQYRYSLRQQPEGDLGQRMSQVFDQALAEYTSVVMIGSDLINIHAKDVERAFELLKQKNPVVLGTTADGGYGLIGLSQYVPQLFEDIPWSTSQVTAITRKRAEDINLNVIEITGFQDIDTYDDYMNYRDIIFKDD